MGRYRMHTPVPNNNAAPDPVSPEALPFKGRLPFREHWRLYDVMSYQQSRAAGRASFIVAGWNEDTHSEDQWISVGGFLLRKTVFADFTLKF